MRVRTLPLTHVDLERQLRDWLLWHGWLVIRTHDNLHPPAEPGVSDLIAARDGRVLLVEIKAKRDRLSEEQRRFREDAAARQVEYVEVRCLEDLESVMGLRTGEIADVCKRRN